MKKMVLAACAALTLIGVVGCGSEGPGGGKEKSDQQQSDKGNGGGRGEGGGRGGGGGQHGGEKLGTSANLTGDQSGSAFEVTVASLQDPAETEQAEAEEGTRYVSARIKVENTGDTTVSGSSVDDGIELKTDDGRVYQPKKDLAAPAGDKSDKSKRGARSVPLEPGDTADRWLLFPVDEGKKPAGVALSSDSPFTEKDVQWKAG